MPPNFTSHDRFYRQTMACKSDEVAFQTSVAETDLWVIARQNLSSSIADYVHKLRGQIQAYALVHPEFLSSLSPLPLPKTAPPIVRSMSRAGLLCGVGPMASVAGAIAQFTADVFCKQSPDILVENGGDLFLRSTKDRVIALLADPKNKAKIGLFIPAQDFPLALCSSSGKVGHSLSFGNGDLVTVRAKSGALADAAATALCNLIQKDKDVAQVIETAKNWSKIGIEGIFAQSGSQIAVWGKMELVALEDEPVNP